MEEKKNKVFEINIFAILKNIVNHRKLLLRNCIVTGFIAIIVAFSIPKTYTVNVSLIPEMNTSNGLSGGMGVLASMAGINLGGAVGEDAIYPDLYPEIVSSIPFLAELYNVQVQTVDGELNTTMADYLEKHQKKAWWSYILGLPGKAINTIVKLFSEPRENDKSATINVFQLSKHQQKILEMIENMMSVMIDNETGLVSLSVTTQDPLVSAEMADTIVANLQRYIIDYRTKKARNDYEQIEELYNSAQADYYKAQNAYAQFVDDNQNIIRARFRTEQDRLENEMTLSYNVYNQLAQQLQIAKAKVLEQTPAYTVIKPATVPLKASAPRKLLMLVGFEFLAIFGTIAWLLSRDMLKSIWQMVYQPKKKQTVTDK